MFRRLWQSGMIALARSPRITSFMQSNRATSMLSGKYTGGSDAAAGVKRARELLQNENIHASLFYLGEYIDDADLVAVNTRQKVEVAGELAKAGLDLHISFDPTQLGFSIDPEIARSNAIKAARAIREHMHDYDGIHCLMFDMEDASVIDATIEMHNQFHDDGYPVALTLQAYLHRTYDDIANQIKRGGKVRLVKGAFVAGSDISFTRRADIKENMRKIISLMFSRQAKQNGFYPIIATHDDAIQDFAIKEAQANGWKQGEYEFEMLMGVRKNLAQRRAGQGETVRLYLPFGKDWWPYGVRRIGENPANVVLLGRSLFS